VTLLTIFTAPKPFTDQHIAMLQRNAIRSWQLLGDESEVLLVGDELGQVEAAEEMGVRNLPGVVKNEYGTPLVSSIFQIAREMGRGEILAYINADIILLPETIQVVKQAMKQKHNFVLMGQRCDLNMQEALDFSPGWDLKLTDEVKLHGRLHASGGSDYFIFPRNLYAEIPDFAVGRAGWDNWMIFHAVSRGWATVDATQSITVIHQNHDYGHLNGEKNHQRHPETFENTKLGGGMRKMYKLLDAKYVMIDDRIEKANRWSLPRMFRALERWLQPDDLVGRGPRWVLLRGVRKIRRALVGSG
jgi:uncharacterized cupredoxin-like copper-binding protein